MNKIILNRDVEVIIPSRPTQITIENVPMLISNFDKQELAQIGAAWTEKLIQEAEDLSKIYDKKPKTKLNKKH